MTMSDILAENLSGKAVIGSDGKRLGMLYNITMEMQTGRLADLLVDPDESVRDLDFETDNYGHYRVPVSRVQAVKDHIVVRR
jgi:sporulation protein YlmC with PRC-barrel domain